MRIKFLSWAVAIATISAVTCCSKSSAQDLPPLDEIISNYIEAIGDRNTIGQVTSVSKKGSIVFATGQQCEISIVQDSGKYLMTTKPGGRDLRRGSNGKVVWEIHPSLGSQLIDGKLKTTFDTNYGVAFPSLTWNKEQFEGEIEVSGIVDLEGAEHYKVSFKPTKGYEATRYFDKETGLVTKLETSQEFSHLGVVDIAVVYSEYRSIENILTPMTQSYSIEGAESYTIEYEEVDFNADIDETTFELPQEVQELLQDDD